MLNAQHESEPSTRPPVRALSPPPVLITEREVALGGPAIALPALRIPFNIPHGGRDNGWS